MMNTRSAILINAKEVSTHSFVDGDISSQSEINADNPELEIPAIESEITVGHELGAPVSTINENNNEKNEQHSYSKKISRKVKKTLVTKKKRRKNMNKLLQTF